ncbi:MAG: hypothetical protein DRP32_08830, partial [Thermotogae bacterium]
PKISYIHDLISRLDIEAHPLLREYYIRKHIGKICIAENNVIFLEKLGYIHDLVKLDYTLRGLIRKYIKYNSHTFHDYSLRKEWLNHTQFICKNEYSKTKMEIYNEAVKWVKDYRKNYLNSFFDETAKEYIKKHDQRLSEFTTRNNSTDLDYVEEELNLWNAVLSDIQTVSQSPNPNTTMQDSLSGFNIISDVMNAIAHIGYNKFCYTTKRKITFLENRKAQSEAVQIASKATFIPNDEHIKDWILHDYISKFKETEIGLYNKGYIDNSYKWKKNKTDLIDFLFVISHHKYFKRIVKGKLIKEFHKRHFISERYGFGKTGLSETAKKHKPKLEIALIPFSWINRLD